MANTIRELREARGLTLEQLADMVGTSFQQISRLEKSTRRLSEKWIRPIAKALGVSPGALLADSLPDTDDSAEATKLLLWRLWTLMGPEDRDFILTYAKTRGFRLQGLPPENKPKLRRRSG